MINALLVQLDSHRFAQPVGASSAPKQIAVSCCCDSHLCSLAEAARAVGVVDLCRRQSFWGELFRIKLRVEQQHDTLRVLEMIFYSVVKLPHFEFLSGHWLVYLFVLLPRDRPHSAIDIPVQKTLLRLGAANDDDLGVEG